METNHRRNFLISTGLLGAGLLVPNIGRASYRSLNKDENLHEFGKREGYTDQISILVSMMDWMRDTVVRDARRISNTDIDFLLDENSNSIGAMLMHLAATERYYQIDTFTGIDEKDLNYGISDSDWSAASSLGDRGRAVFKGKPKSFYLNILKEVRDFSLNELKNRNDDWLMQSTNFFDNQQTNNYCKWFHVVEHESNHNGQMRYIGKRVN